MVLKRTRDPPTPPQTAARGKQRHPVRFRYEAERAFQAIQLNQTLGHDSPGSQSSSRGCIVQHVTQHQCDDLQGAPARHRGVAGCRARCAAERPRGQNDTILADPACRDGGLIRGMREQREIELTALDLRQECRTGTFHDADLAVRVSGEMVREHGRQEPAAQGRWDTDRNARMTVPASARMSRTGAVEVLNELERSRIETPRRHGRGDGARVAIEQRRADVRLERSDLNADTRLRGVQPLRGPREVASSKAATKVRNRRMSIEPPPLFSSRQCDRVYPAHLAAPVPENFAAPGDWFLLYPPMSCA